MDAAERQNNNKNRWYVVVNPAAGQGQSQRSIQTLDTLCREAGLDAEVVVTEGPLHACDLARAAVQNGFERFLVAGGDGSVHEVLNGMFLADRHARADFVLGLLPLGSANDWARSLQLPKRWQEILRLAAEDQVIKHDIGMVDCQGPRGERRHYFMNVAGVGFDAHVLEAMGNGKKNRWTYLVFAIRELWRYRTQKVRLGVDGEVVEAQMLGLFAGPGRFFGGRLEILPGTRPDAGALRATLIHDGNRTKILFTLLPRLFNGKIDRSPLAQTLLGREITVRSQGDELGLEGDGEFLGRTPARFSIIPAALKVVSGSAADATAAESPPA